MLLEAERVLGRQRYRGIRAKRRHQCLASTRTNEAEPGRAHTNAELRDSEFRVVERGGDGGESNSLRAFSRLLILSLASEFMRVGASSRLSPSHVICLGWHQRWHQLASAARLWNTITTHSIHSMACSTERRLTPIGRTAPFSHPDRSPARWPRPSHTEVRHTRSSRRGCTGVESRSRCGQEVALQSPTSRRQAPPGDAGKSPYSLL